MLDWVTSLAMTQHGSAMLVMGLIFMVGLIPLIGAMIFKR